MFKNRLLFAVSKELLEYAKQAVEMAIEKGENAATAWLQEMVGV